MRGVVVVSAGMSMWVVQVVQVSNMCTMLFKRRKYCLHILEQLNNRCTTLIHINPKLCINIIIIMYNSYSDNAIIRLQYYEYSRL